MAPLANLGILIPVLWSGRAYAAKQLVPFFRAAEELGFGSLWTPDRVFHAQVAMPHPLITLSLAAGATERVGLGTAVVITGVRNPIETAQQAASLDALSGGRLTLGVGLGGREHEYAALGVDIRRRVSRFEEGVALMRRLWTEESVTFAGRYFALEGASILPRPERAIPTPIGARAAPALARAGRIGDGWIQGGRGSAQEFRESWALVRESAHAAGRDPDALTSGKLLYANPGRDAAAAEAEVRRHTVAYYGREMGEAQTVAAGPPERVAEVVREFIDAGCQTPMLGLPEPDVDKLAALAHQVAPLL